MRCLVKQVCNSKKMKNVTLFLSFCWILWFSQIFAISTMFGGLPDIPANPAVITLGDKAPELILDDPLNGDDAETIDASTNNTEDNQEQPTSKSFTQDGIVIMSEPKSSKKEVVLPQEVPPDEPPPQVDDSGGRTVSRHQDASKNIQDVKDSHISAPQDAAAILDIPVSSGEDTSSSPSPPPEVNLTVEENPMPVFSEWAQKRMEEAEKKLEKEVVNSSAMKKNTVTGNKQQPLKLRTKNYASPDCGAKIIASNADAQNTGALLTSTKDEYMLSPCTNRIWFVVELCEAIQAEKVDLANFELFSSSPKNFSVAVSNRFPTREWSNVGRFVADDQRNIQSFALHPHLFGKFVRVDIHSHYNSEHFCPISLFRVYGTSEFEAFETENRLPADDLDDFDDEDAAEVSGNNLNKNENNLFKSASDAVLSIVKKAAEVLVKTNSNKTEADALASNKTSSKLQFEQQCSTLRHAFICEKCEESIVNRTNDLLSCRYNQLISLLGIEILRAHLLTSQICAKRFNLDTLAYDSLACTSHSSPYLDEQNSFILNAFPLEYLAAICHILVTDINSKRHSRYGSTGPGSDSAMNLTIDQKPGTGQFVNIENRSRHAKPVPKSKLPKLPTKDSTGGTVVVNPSKKIDLSKGRDDEHTPSQSEGNTKTENEKDPKTRDSERSSTTANSGTDSVTIQKDIDISHSEESKPILVPDVNIFNLVDDVPETGGESVDESTEGKSAADENVGDSNELASSQNKSEEVNNIQDSTGAGGSALDIEPTTWDNIDHMLNEQGTSDTAETSEGGSSFTQQAPQRVHSESVFLRLSNRIKALERNMSLSGQYLEELSRRYKKQVEELQHSFAKTLATIDEQNRRALEKEQILITQNRNLNEQLNEISTRLNNWIVFGICFFVFLMFQTFVLWLRSHRENRRILKHFEESSLSQRRRSTPRKKLLRQKSVEGVSGHPSPTHKSRRPSEEADRISGSYKNLLIDDEVQNIGGMDEAKDTFGEMGVKTAKPRNRKISSARRNGSLEPKALLFGRQESAPGDFVRPNVSPSVGSQEDDGMILEDDYETYVPGTDLAYNEFMPEGPSGSQMNGKVQNGTKTSSKKTSKVRRLSSPSFLKSTFSRSGSAKKSAHSPTGWEWYRLRKSEPKSTAPSAAGDTNRTNASPSSQQANDVNGKPSKKSRSESPELSIKLNGFGNGSSTPNSSISTDVMAASSNHNGSDDSIRTSETSLTTAGSILSNGNRHSSSTKKHGSFRRILKKVF
ncbi:SUN domain-containing ossification factor isoform X3 [Hermetia illucens]|nr:SUN domain-containing ossification factor isoform X3 [Hermetia illucens]XP_037903781.1 SUN domain-containing ossification factor isoform X3 [Hermetia illucens]XP_037903782.1 SUN domain-containing ossification factor isoform X3 [Hermetia illucens]XP_037903783.1 SUN domain-containing ossification factor isoform X3 [Hermetia illucens]XP_037903784.1 SUN domain-containing ossification factor isoform X3 [Hermetia illucens]XP_037903785.1 SUN domain-containing ossification factor isoform X3 [Hermet